MNPIVVVDDEPAIRSSLAAVLEDEGYPVRCCAHAQEFYDALKEQPMSLVLLDIWLPGEDGMAILKNLRNEQPELPVIMMSGHAGIEAAVSAIKLGARDFLEKPLHLDVLLDKITGALRATQLAEEAILPSDTRIETAPYQPATNRQSVELRKSGRPQCTLGDNVVLNGTGLLSGRNTGIILSPAPPSSGIQFQTLDGISIPGRITSLEDYQHAQSQQSFTANSTVLARENRRVRTVEHLMAALSMAGLDNVLIKADEEIPNVDGSALDFARLLDEVGTVDQDAEVTEAVICEKLSIGEEDLDQKYLYVEPYDGFEVTMRVNYPPPILEQQLTFNAEQDSFLNEIAPARSFNTFQNIDMAQKMGKVGSGYLNSHIIIYDGKVINTELRFTDEFVRHKILDLIGDLFLLGYPLRGRVVANMTSHGYNQALVQKMYSCFA
ncbi:MAG: UDP-3-O-[3-hydroxymyristoyl] N-acetylglucosamine deacetylase [Deltaproteobacteria bacterium]|nr:UDP-3-O-[3-hydroxymyristoyl] N-acetylglucosamine deacetylase [Deltaproteobacteria bacterium]